MNKILKEISEIKCNGYTVFDVTLVVSEGSSELILFNKVTGREVRSGIYEPFNKLNILNLIKNYTSKSNLEPIEPQHISQIINAYYDMECRNV